MASTIKVKRSAVQGKAPTAGNLETGEIALNTRDGRLYSKGTQVFEVGANTHSVFVGTGGATFGNGAFSLPTTDGSADQVIKTNGSGVLSWVDQSSGGATIQTMPFYNSSGSLDTITITGSSFTFYDSTGTADSIDISTDINLNSLADVSVAAPSLNQVLRYDGTSWVSSDSAGASWSALTSTNTAIRTLVGQNLANTNAYIATKLDSSSYTTADVQSKAALANTNAYIATKAPLSSPSFTGNVQLTGPTGGNAEIYLTDGDNTGLGNSLLIKQAGSQSYIVNRNNSSLYLGTGGSSKLEIDSIGRTKIGDGLGPNYLLDVVTSDGDSVVQVKTAGTDATDDTIIRNVIGGTSAKNYINFGDSADDDIGGIIYDHGTDALSINVNATEAMNIASNGDITTAGSITPGRYRTGQVIEELHAICNTTSLHGRATIQNVTGSQTLSTTYADATGSVVTSYTPPTGTKMIVYEYTAHLRWADAHAISHWRLYYQVSGGSWVEVVDARTNRNGYYPEDKQIMRWVFEVGAASDDSDSGVFSAATPQLGFKWQTRDYSTGNRRYALHLTQYWDGGGTDVYSQPMIMVKAIA